ncbi:MAG: DUF4421 family protein [Bacteroidales bacterium]|nr:DUF4421 family protein [Bacteroidales bacterium]
MKILKLFILVLFLNFCGTAMAQRKLVSLVKDLETFIDTMSVKGVDRNYIDMPDEPWQVIIRNNVSQTIVSMKTEGTIGGTAYSVSPYLETSPSKYLGLWVGYRGYGLGYLVNVGGDKGSYFTIGLTGGAYGLNLRMHTFDNSNPSFNLNSELIPEGQEGAWEVVELIDPISVTSVFADGYYMFNGKRFSYAAAYDQSLIQKRSAGSLMVGLMYTHTHIDYASDYNADLIYTMQGMGQVKLWQGSAGVGYAYNWVPTRGLLINVMAMPMLTFVNRLKVYAYATNIDELMEDPLFWDEEISDEEWDAWFYGNSRITYLGDKSFNSGLSIGLDARVSLSYNFGRYFFSAYGQFNNIRYQHNNTDGYLNDWFINTSLGVRL